MTIGKSLSGSFPPSFNPAIVLDQTLREIKVENKLR
jgi:hypothetical protein